MGDTCSSAISCRGCKGGSCNCHEFDTVEINANQMIQERRQNMYKRDQFIEWLRDRVTLEVENINTQQQMSRPPSEYSGRTQDEVANQMELAASQSFGTYSRQSLSRGASRQSKVSGGLRSDSVRQILQEAFILFRNIELSE